MLFACGGRGWLTGLHSGLGSFLIEEQWQGLGKEILGVHPRVTELIGGKLLDTVDTLLIEELHVVAGVTIEEVIGTHTQPEQMQFLVKLGSIVIDIRDIR